MSIILRALKKIQEEKAKEADLASKEGADGKEIDVDSEIDPGSAPADEVSVGREAARPAFGSGPKLLLISVLILGVFTTGWFASRIYLSVNPTAKTEEPEPQADKRAPSGSTAASTTLTPAIKHAPVEATDRVETQPISTPEAHAAQQPEEPPALVDEHTPPKIAMTEPDAKPPSQPAPEAREATLEKKGRPELKINAIAWRSTEPKAIVNMQRVYEGDVIEGATVLAIERKAVLFKYEGDVFEVRF